MRATAADCATTLPMAVPEQEGGVVWEMASIEKLSARTTRKRNSAWQLAPRCERVQHTPLAFSGKDKSKYPNVRGIGLDERFERLTKLSGVTSPPTTLF